MDFQKSQLKRNSIILVLVFISFLFYVGYRAYNLSFTHDESLSYSIIKGNTILIDTANNHLLNTYLMGICSSLFGTSEFSMRLPNVLAFLMLALAYYLIVKNERNTIILLIGLIILLFNPFMLEFFGLARGYGLSTGLIMMSLYFLLRNGFNKIPITQLYYDLYFTLIFGALAMFANLTMINFYIASILIFGIKILVNRNIIWKNFKSKMLIVTSLILSFIPLYFIIQRVFALQEVNQLYFGGNDLIDPLRTLIDTSIYTDYDHLIIIKYAYWFLGIVALIGISLLLKTKQLNSQFGILILLIGMITGGMFIEHVFFDSKYPIERSALFIWPLIGLFVFYTLQLVFQQHLILKLTFLPIITIGVIALLINFKIGANLDRSIQWLYDMNTKSTVKEMLNTPPKSTNFIVRSSWLYSPTLIYYKELWGLDIQIYNDDYPNIESDFLLRFNDTSYIEKYQRIKYYNESKCELLMNPEIHR